MAVKIRPVLHIEVKLQSNGNGVPIAQPIINIICVDIARWITAKYAYLKVDDPIRFLDLDEVQRVHGAVQCVEIVNVSGDGQDNEPFFLDDVELDVQAYELHDDAQLASPGANRATESAEGEESQPQAMVTTLPGKSLDGLWNSLVFDTSVHKRLLRFLTRMMMIANKPNLNLVTMNWNRLILLYGPPGTGKTTLCRALAQKLAIRLGRDFYSAKLIEINCEALLSKWFSESVKMIGKMFDGVQSLAEDSNLLVCVLIDEVENLTGSREKAVKGNECSDSIRATNRLLTALDRLRHRPNIIVFCTSNLLAALDAAFVDRVDLKQHIPSPSIEARYEILRSCLNELIACNVVSTATQQPANPNPHDTAAPSNTLSSTPMLEPPPTPPKSHIPDAKTYKFMHWGHADTPAARLWAIAERSKGMSGRTLRRLPFLAVAMHTYSDPCALDEALEALGRAVDDEDAVRAFGEDGAVVRSIEDLAL